MRFDLAALERFFGLGALSATKQHRLNVNRSWSAERYVAGEGPALERYQVVERGAPYRPWIYTGPAPERYLVSKRESFRASWIAVHASARMAYSAERFTAFHIARNPFGLQY